MEEKRGRKEKGGKRREKWKVGREEREEGRGERRKRQRREGREKGGKKGGRRLEVRIKSKSHLYKDEFKARGLAEVKGEFLPSTQRVSGRLKRN